MLWLAIHFPRLQLDHLMLSTDEAYPVAIVDGRSNKVVQVNECALADGVRCGLGIATAASLSASLKVLPYQAELEQQLLEQMANELYQVTADIVLQAPNTLLLNVEHMKRLYGTLSEYWRTLTQRLSDYRLSYHAACGFSHHSAELLAKANVTLMSSDHKQINNALAKLPIECLPLTNKVLTTFSRIGVKSLAQLFQLPTKSLSQRFPADVGQYLLELKGDLPAKVDFFKPKLSFLLVQELLFEVSDHHILLKPINKMLIRLEAYLKKRDLLTQRITFSFVDRDGETSQVSLASVEFLYRAQSWLQLCELKLAKHLFNSPVVTVHLSVDEFMLNNAQTNDFFCHKKGSFDYQQLLSLLLNKIGEQHVHQLSMANSHEPEKATLYQSLNSKLTNTVSSVVTEPDATYQIPLRPSFLLGKPEPLLMPVSVVHGPERIQTAWWQVDAVARDYFVAKSEDGQWCWVYREPDSRWFLHGYFA